MKEEPSEELKIAYEELISLRKENWRLAIQHGVCSVCGYVAWKEQDSGVQHCMFCELRSSLADVERKVDQLLDEKVRKTEDKK
jgi:hypothetical protein